MCRQLSNDRLSVPFMYTNIGYQTRPKLVCDTQCLVISTTCWFKAFCHQPLCLPGMASSPPSTVHSFCQALLWTGSDNLCSKKAPSSLKVTFQPFALPITKPRNIVLASLEGEQCGRRSSYGWADKASSLDVDTCKIVWIPTLSSRHLLLVSFNVTAMHPENIFT